MTKPPALRRTKFDPEGLSLHVLKKAFLELSPSYALAHQIHTGEVPWTSLAGRLPSYFHKVMEAYKANGNVHLVQFDDWFTGVRANPRDDLEAPGLRLLRSTMTVRNLDLNARLITQVVGSKQFRSAAHRTRVWNRLWQQVPLRSNRSGDIRSVDADGKKQRLDLTDSVARAEANDESLHRLLYAYRIAENAACDLFPSSAPLDGELNMREWLLTPFMHERIREMSRWSIEQDRIDFREANPDAPMNVAAWRHVDDISREGIVEMVESLSRSDAVDWLTQIEVRPRRRQKGAFLMLRDVLRERLQRESNWWPHDPPSFP